MFRLDRQGPLARITLDRPEARNAIPLDGWDDLCGQVEEVAGGDARLLVLAGTGGAFCAGADLGDFPRLRRDAGARARFREAMRGAIDAVAALPIPVVAWIDGACYGAGVALALACDVRIAGPQASFAITPARYGIAYPQQDVRRLVALIGPGQASRLLFTGQSIDGAEALRIGLVERVGGLDELTGSIAANEAVSLVALKRAIAATRSRGATEPSLDREFDALFGGEALARRLEALRPK